MIGLFTFIGVTDIFPQKWWEIIVDKIYNFIRAYLSYGN